MLFLNFFSFLSFISQVIKNPISDHLPVGCRKLATSYNAEKVVHPRNLVPADDPIVIVVGAMAHGKVCNIPNTLKGFHSENIIAKSIY